MEAFYIILGGWMLYSVGHFLVIQFKDGYKKRTKYEKFLTINSIVIIFLLYLSIMS